ncbi:DUF2541 family protein [Shewanella sp. NIFS-20-20]|uniref:DUF2541 family protein n=1 Tax=Shewanella sp. NIFS-20-20 TaxID=2853806 RepID=UPI001C4411BA|nr:DUF2541 family protein [Shewanella sp. NIFS-20-20]MBV7316524.1 DUF2541 family protein [Shewanella sp. NIFS-20-20]
MFRLSIASLLLATTAITLPSIAVADDEQITLGRTILLGSGDHGAKIPLLVCRKANAIKVKAERDLTLERVVVTFNNGDTKTIRFYRDLKKNQTTDWRKFAYKRCVKKLEVFGNSEGSKAGVKVLGRK